MRVALVTGGAVRIGRAIVEELARRGWAVAFTYRRSEAPARELEASILQAGGDAAALCFGLDDPADRTALVERLLDRFGGLDALVNNAAVFPRTPLDELDEARLREVLAINLEAPLFLARLLAPTLRARRGAIVNLTDIHADIPLRHHLAYTVSKAALAAATRALAIELAPEVRVNAVAPGAAVFPDGMDEAVRRRIIDRTLLKRQGGAAEIAGAVRFLLEEAETITGQVLAIDGGRSLVS
ncbi:MAG: SDR family oxidoreductase [Acidobacteriota bacterium]